MEFTVGMTVKGRFYKTIKANSFEEAAKLAEEAYYDADFGDLKDIDMEIISATDENDAYYFYV